MTDWVDRVGVNPRAREVLKNGGQFKCKKN